MSEQHNGDRIWDIMERVGVCMLTTQAAGRLRARPLEARPDRKAGLIFAVTDFSVACTLSSASHECSGRRLTTE